MINNWNKFEIENELYGDMSLYCNYREVIENMRLEELEIEEK